MKRNNIFAKYYKWIYNNLPNDSCSFFWGSLLIITLSPIFILGRLICNKYNDETPKRFAVGLLIWVTTFYMILVGILPIILIMGKEYLQSLNIFIIILLSFLSGVITLGILGGIVWGSYYLNERRVEHSYSSNEPSYVEKISDWIGTIRGKYCTKINWKE